MWHIGQSLTALDHTGCVLKWDESLAYDLDGYHVYMRTGEVGAFTRMTRNRLTAPEWMSPPLRSDTRYFFYITAIDRSDNESGPSAVVSFERAGGNVDPAIIPVPRPRTLMIASGGEHQELIATEGTYMRFEIGGD